MSRVKRALENYKNESAEFGISGISPVCSLCKNLDRNAPAERKCSAFDSIPLDIWTGKNKHIASYPGDGGIRFSPIEIKRAA